jgi:hypothetical protein
VTYALALVAIVLPVQQWLHLELTEIAVTHHGRKNLIRREINEIMLDYTDVKILA